MAVAAVAVTVAEEATVAKKFGDLRKACWKGYKAVGLKQKGDRQVPNCVPEETVMESGGPVVYKTEGGHIEQYASNSFAVYKDGVKKTYYTSLEAAKAALQEAAPAWTRKEGKSPTGGLNRKGIESYRRANPGSKLSMAVTTPPSKLDPDSKAAKRRRSFCARMGGSKGPMKDENGKPTRKALALRKWNC